MNHLANAELAIELEERERQAAAPEREKWRRVWAALMLALDVSVFRSVLLGRPVIASQLDAVVLRRALRGMPLPPPDSFVRVRSGHLDAIAESGPLPAPTARGRARR